MGHTHHAIDYVELGVNDLAATREFYAAAFGWEFNDTARRTPASGPPTVTGRWAGSTRPTARSRAVAGRWYLLFSDDLDATRPRSRPRRAG